MNDDAILYEQDRALRAAPWNAESFAQTFRHDVMMVGDGVRIHYVLGGVGPAVVLLHGNPQL